jgi:Serine aminopeptidase, S33
MVLGSSTRVDRELGIREVVQLFGSRPAQMFGCLHAPLKHPLAAVVICPSVAADFTLSYRRQVVLARSLASRGVLVQRFHYRGSGNSHGDPSAVTYDSLVEDARTAIALMRERAHSTPLALLGMGWGAMVAATADFRLPVALWEPISEPRRYYHDALRARMIRHVVEPAGRPASAGHLLEELETTGSIDVVGYSLYRGLHETSRERTLTGELGTRPRRILVVQPAGKDALRTDYGRLVGTWRERGFDVESATVGKPAPIWFHGPHVRQSDGTACEVGARVHAWLCSQAAS